MPLKALVCAALVLLVAGCAGGNDGDDEGEATATTITRTVTATPRGGGDGDDTFGGIPGLVDAVAPSIVAVLVSSGQGEGEGSGVVWSEDGVVVTAVQDTWIWKTPGVWAAPSDWYTFSITCPTSFV